MVDFNFITERSKFPSALEVNFSFGSTAFEFLSGSSNTITAVWASADAGRTSGKVYVASIGDGAAFSVLDLKIKSLYDSCTITQKGRANELLAQEDPIDVVAGGL